MPYDIEITNKKIDSDFKKTYNANIQVMFNVPTCAPTCAYAELLNKNLVQI